MKALIGKKVGDPCCKITALPLINLQSTDAGDPSTHCVLNKHFFKDMTISISTHIFISFYLGCHDPVTIETLCIGSDLSMHYCHNCSYRKSWTSSDQSEPSIYRHCGMTNNKTYRIVPFKYLLFSSSTEQSLKVSVRAGAFRLSHDHFRINRRHCL